jgi:hypothetical protein
MKFDKASISAYFEKISSKLYIKARDNFCLNGLDLCILEQSMQRWRHAYVMIVLDHMLIL